LEELNKTCKTSAMIASDPAEIPTNLISNRILQHRRWAFLFSLQLALSRDDFGF
jgi:hypothetical protein